MGAMGCHRLVEAAGSTKLALINASHLQVAAVILEACLGRFPSWPGVPPDQATRQSWTAHSHRRRTHRGRVQRGLHLDAAAGGDALVIRMLYSSHFGDQVGPFYQCGGRIAARADDFLMRRAAGQSGQDFANVHQPVVHCVVDFIQHDQVVVRIGQSGLSDFPGLLNLLVVIRRRAPAFGTPSK